MFWNETELFSYLGSVTHMLYNLGQVILTPLNLSSFIHKTMIRFSGCFVERIKCMDSA